MEIVLTDDASRNQRLGAAPAHLRSQVYMRAYLHVTRRAREGPIHDAALDWHVKVLTNAATDTWKTAIVRVLLATHLKSHVSISPYQKSLQKRHNTTQQQDMQIWDGDMTREPRQAMDDLLETTVDAAVV